MARSPRRLVLPTALAAGLLTLLARPASADNIPRISLQELVGQSTVIAVAHTSGEWGSHLRGHDAELELTRILKGDAKPGKCSVPFDLGISVGWDRADFLAFLHQGTQLWFAARPVLGTGGLEDGILRVESQENVGYKECLPGIWTLAQFETFLKAGTLTYAFRGPLCFPGRGRAEWEASPLEVEVRYDAVADDVVVRGLPELKGFPARPQEMLVGHLRHDGVVLTYSSDFLTPLEIQGRAESVDPQTGLLKCRFSVLRPTVLSREEFEGYVADPYKGRPEYAIKLCCEPAKGMQCPRALTLRGDWLEGWTDAPLPVETRGSWHVNVGETHWVTAKLPSGEEVALRFDLGDEDTKELLVDSFAHRLMAGDMQGRVLLRDAEGELEVASFTASLGDVQVRPAGQATGRGAATARSWPCTGRPGAVRGGAATASLFGWAVAAGIVVVLAALAVWGWRRKGRPSSC
jgi:hypothetical protein